METVGEIKTARAIAIILPKLAHAAVAVAGVTAGFTAAVSVVTVLEGLWARGRLLAAGYTTESVSTVDDFGSHYDGDRLELTLLGDSLAVGVGAGSPEATVGFLLAEGLSRTARRPVRLRNVAVVGSQSSELVEQLRALEDSEVRPAVAVIIVGGNDVMHLQGIPTAAKYLAHAVRQLRRRGAHVVVATCPDMGTVRPFFQPLRFFAHWLSRLLATTQTIVVLRNGGRAVSLADTVGPIFRQAPRLMFSTDSLHPSALGYARAAEVLLPSVCAAAGYRRDGGGNVPHRIYRKGGRYPLAWFAFRASREAGTEITPAHDRHGRPAFLSGRPAFLNGLSLPNRQHA